MPATIYYFTGSGNSLAIARQLAAELGETDLVPIPKALDAGTLVRAPAGAVGFVIPVYVLGLPKIVARFAEQADLTGAEYIFCVCTLAERGMTGAFGDLEKILGRKQKVLDAAFGIFMPRSNVHGPEADPAARQELFRCATQKVTEIATLIRGRRSVKDTEPGWNVRVLRFFRPIFYGWMGLGGSGKFSVLETCSGCTTCEKVCPVGNITMENKRPVWHDTCELCFACVNFCPRQSVRLGRNGGQDRHYHHPDIMVRDMMEQHGRKPDLSAFKNR
jgi:ferredoxin